MKIARMFSAFAAAAALCLLCACGGKPDAGVLFREAKANAAAMKSCSASVGSVLTFTADGRRHTFESSGSVDFTAKPFALKSVQTCTNDGVPDNSVTYTVTENGGLWFYCKNGSGWRKTSSQGLDPSPLTQIDTLGLLNDAEEEKYVRETTAGARKTHKIELKLKSEALRGTVENIVTASGMAGGSRTIVQTLLASAPPVYGYCYIDENSGQPVRLELDAAAALNQIFQGVEGSGVSIRVEKCEMSGNFGDINSLPAIRLPSEAKSASSVQAFG